jgi:hypothetical protein
MMRQTFPVLPQLCNGPAINSSSGPVGHFSHVDPFAEFWKFIPPTEPYRVLLAEVRDKLYYTREHFQAQLEGRQSFMDETELLLRTDDVSTASLHWFSSEVYEPRADIQ